MTLTPELLAGRFVEAGCTRLIVHAESVVHLHRTLDAVRQLGATAGVALNPSTPASAVSHVLDLVDLVLVMTVNPGFGGQRYLATMEPKIREVRRLVDESGSLVEVEVDGGITPGTVAGASAAGANVFVAGTSLFEDPRGLHHAVDELRNRATSAARSAVA
jgi:ribulose-phosphate 3-epimerase